LVEAREFFAPPGRSTDSSGETTVVTRAASRLDGWNASTS
jgi:hypothetical protein